MTDYIQAGWNWFTDLWTRDVPAANRLFSTKDPTKVTVEEVTSGVIINEDPYSGGTGTGTASEVTSALPETALGTGTTVNIYPGQQSTDSGGMGMMLMMMMMLPMIMGVFGQNSGGKKKKKDEEDWSED